SVTSADVRLRFGNGLRNPGTSCFKKKRKVTRVRRPGPCRCVGGSQIVTPEKPSHPPLSPPPCRIGTAELGVLARSWAVVQWAGSGKTQVTRQDRASCVLDISHE